MVHGVVYRIARGERRMLDRAEDLGQGYDRVRLRVSVGGRQRVVFAYLARHEAIRDGLRPFDWYLEYVQRGARHHGLTGRYLQRLQRELSVRDWSSARRRFNRRVLLSGAPPYRRQ